MGAIVQNKKRLNTEQIECLKLLTYGEMKIVKFCKKIKVSQASVRKARHGEALSETLMNKIIKAL